MERRQHGCFLFRRHVLWYVQSKDGATDGNVFRESPQTVGFRLDYLTNDLAGRVGNVKGMVATKSADAAAVLGLDGCEGSTVPIHNFQRRGEASSSPGFHNVC